MVKGRNKNTSAVLIPTYEERDTQLFYHVGYSLYTSRLLSTNDLPAASFNLSANRQQPTLPRAFGIAIGRLRSCLGAVFFLRINCRYGNAGWCRRWVSIL
ncbi:unnamed protein product [Cuscuta europaea]|uniref:Uncharacterized protein n=1 Tax=Cuscuta europaea TaxID=41803 RepID=A0A9P1E1S0_CUSEU|nr:unnamed protein product [Cuscuta europaea]